MNDCYGRQNWRTSNLRRLANRWCSRRMKHSRFIRIWLAFDVYCCFIVILFKVRGIVFRVRFCFCFCFFVSLFLYSLKYILFVENEWWVWIVIWISCNMFKCRGKKSEKRIQIILYKKSGHFFGWTDCEWIRN